MLVTVVYFFHVTILEFDRGRNVPAQFSSCRSGFPAGASASTHKVQSHPQLATSVFVKVGGEGEVRGQSHVRGGTKHEIEVCYCCWLCNINDKETSEMNVKRLKQHFSLFINKVKKTACFDRLLGRNWKCSSFRESLRTTELIDASALPESCDPAPKLYKRARIDPVTPSVSDDDDDRKLIDRWMI